MTCAPIFRATSGVPSVELLSTTMTSVTKWEGRSASTRPIACASLWVGIITDTRKQIPSSPQQRLGVPPRQNRIDSPDATRASDRQPKASHHRNQQLPDPRRTQFRNPKAAKQEECGESGGTREQTKQQQDSQ